MLLQQEWDASEGLRTQLRALWCMGLLTAGAPPRGGAARVVLPGRTALSSGMRGGVRGSVTRCLLLSLMGRDGSLARRRRAAFNRWLAPEQDQRQCTADGQRLGAA